MNRAKENIYFGSYPLWTNLVISISLIYQHWTKQKEKQNKCIYI